MKDELCWYEIENVESVVSPSLLVYPDRIKKNIEMMITMAGGTENLRPHIKTHKIAEVILMQLDYGIAKFKCATIAEAELLAEYGAKDILLAIQPVGINVRKFFELMLKYPESAFSTIVDNFSSLAEISKNAEERNILVSLWLDVNNGMDRTGIEPNNVAIELYTRMENDPKIIAKGLHVYDGHIHESDFNLRKNICDEGFIPVENLRDILEESRIQIDTIVAGGTPTFPIHSKRKNVETSPGTPLLWDQGYAKLYPDLKFLPAAVLLSRVISKPKANLVCLDLGHKSVASEMQLPRVRILNGKNCTQLSQSEEHLVIECSDSKGHDIGSECYSIPMHICPTVTKYGNLLTVVDGKITGSWQVAARDH